MVTFIDISPTAALYNVRARARVDGGGSSRLLDFTNDLLGYFVIICGSHVCETWT